MSETDESEILGRGGEYRKVWDIDKIKNLMFILRFRVLRSLKQNKKPLLFTILIDGMGLTPYSNNMSAKKYVFSRLP